MSFQFLQNSEIDKGRWDALVGQYGNGRMYMLSEYLDATASHWTAIIYGDYEYVMPLPYKSYLFGIVKRHYIPLFIQQLGIIGNQKISQELKENMILSASQRFSKFIHSFNHENGQLNIPGFESKSRTNYELHLIRPYESISENYKQNISRNLKSAQEEGLLFSENAEWKILEQFISDYSNTNDPTSKNVSILTAIGNLSNKDFSNNIFQVTKDNEILAVCMAPRYQNRITLLIPRSSPKGRKLNAMAFLIDQIIQKYSGQEMVLDFEGSMIPGVAQFYQQFGSTNRSYSTIQ